jgi:hypothetical protein
MDLHTKFKGLTINESSSITLCLGNVDIALTILSYVNISDVDNFTKFLQQSLYVSTDIIKYLTKVRRTPIALFSKIVDDPLEFLEMMMKCRIILSGSRAVSFMYPIFSSDNSDWDFYSGNALTNSYTINHIRDTSTKYGPIEFMKYLSDQGAIWSQRKFDTTYDNISEIRVYSGVIKRGNKIYKLQLIGRDAIPFSSFTTMINFHCSVVQCFITGFSVVSMYNALSSTDRMLVWDINDITPRLGTDALIRIMKCKPHLVIHKFTNLDAISKQLSRMRYEYEVLLFQYTTEDPNRDNVTVLREKVLIIANKIIEILTPARIRHLRVTTEDIYTAIAGRCTCNDPSPAQQAVKKYISRGFKPITFNDYLAIKDEKRDTNYYVNIRNITDSISYTADFIDYLNPEVQYQARNLFKKSLSSHWYELGDFTNSERIGTTSIEYGIKKLRDCNLRIPLYAITMNGF